MYEYRNQKVRRNMETIKLNYYAIIPAHVRYCKNITMGAKLLYGEITALTNKEGYCWATNEYFQKLYDVDKTTIIRWLNQLIDNNFIFKSTINNQRKLSIIGSSKNATPRSKNATYIVAKTQPMNNKKNNTKDKLINDKTINDKLTNYLINIHYIDSFEPHLDKYNKLFGHYRALIGEEKLNDCVSYVLSKSNYKNILNKYYYLETSIEKYKNEINFIYE